MKIHKLKSIEEALELAFIALAAVRPIVQRHQDRRLTSGGKTALEMVQVAIEAVQDVLYDGTGDEDEGGGES